MTLEFCTLAEKFIMGAVQSLDSNGQLLAESGVIIITAVNDLI